MKDVRDKAHNTSLGIRCLLIECPRWVALAYQGWINTKKLLSDQHKMENTGFLLAMILFQSTAPFSISGPMRFYSALRAMSQDISSL
jgi:hypothetical protein